MWLHLRVSVSNTGVDCAGGSEWSSRSNSSPHYTTSPASLGGVCSALKELMRMGKTCHRFHEWALKTGGVKNKVGKQRLTESDKGRN